MISLDSVTSCSNKSCNGPFAFVLFCVLVALTTVGATGCGKSADTVPVHGHASYRGEAIANGAVTFFPTTGRPTMASLSAAGEYTAALPPGDYVVAITVGSKLPEGFKEGDVIPPAKNPLPPEYTARATSKLRATVAQDQDQPVDFKLE